MKNKNYSIQKTFDSYSITVENESGIKGYFDVPEGIIDIIKQLEQENERLISNWNELKKLVQEQIIEYNRMLLDNPVMSINIQNNFIGKHQAYSLINLKMQELEKRGGVNE